MTAHEIAAKQLQDFLNEVGRVPAIGGFGPKAQQQPATDSSFALRAAVSHAREALEALERGDTGAFLALYQAFRDFQLNAERHEADALASLAVEAERQHAEQRVEAERAKALAKVEAERRLAEERLEAERRQAEERVEAERAIRKKGPRNAASTSADARRKLDEDAWQAAQKPSTGDLVRNGRLNVSGLAERICETHKHFGVPAVVAQRLTRYAKDNNIDLDKWASNRPPSVAAS